MKWMFSHRPEMAKRWADKTPNTKKLPEHKNKKGGSAFGHKVGKK